MRKYLDINSSGLADKLLVAELQRQCSSSGVTVHYATDVLFIICIVKQFTEC